MSTFPETGPSGLKSSRVDLKTVTTILFSDHYNDSVKVKLIKEVFEIKLDLQLIFNSVSHDNRKVFCLSIFFDLSC